jgi:GNAT superfamily N-acetyltransferase
MLNRRSIKIAKSSDMPIIAHYMYQKQSNKASSCKVCPHEFGEIQTHVKKILEHDTDFALVMYSGNDITGVGCFFNEPEEQYLECVGGFFDDEADFLLVIPYLQEKCKGSRVDFVYPLENKKILGYLKNAKADFDEPALSLKLILKDFVLQESSYKIAVLSEDYCDAYRKIHQDKNKYWKADLVLESPALFMPHLAIHEGTVIGYIDITFGKELVEIYDLFVIDEYRDSGYTEALINEAIRAVLKDNNTLAVHIDLSDSRMKKIYNTFGFIEEDISQTVSLFL